jgi:hypothetical protein
VNTDTRLTKKEIESGWTRDEKRAYVRARRPIYRANYDNLSKLRKLHACLKRDALALNIAADTWATVQQVVDTRLWGG